MHHHPPKSSEELAAELEKMMPRIHSGGHGWRMLWIDGTTIYANQRIYEVAQLVLAQQQEIRQLKAELDELKKR